MPSSTVENYVKQIYLLQQFNEDLVSMGKLAGILGVVPGTVTTMIKTLADSGLVVYEPRGGVRLSRGGEQLALHVLRRHRLVELLLVKVLGLDWSEVHDEAEELEHAISDKVLEKIDALLEHPSVDPHGDPIPSAKGKVPGGQHLSLMECAAGDTVRISRILDQNPAFLQFIGRSGLTPGVTVTVQARDPLADSLSIRPAGSAPITLGSAAAAKILINPLA